MNIRHNYFFITIMLIFTVSLFSEKKSDVKLSTEQQHLNRDLEMLIRIKPSLNEIQTLIDRGADINMPGKNGWSPLLNAVLYNNDPEIIKYFINNGADVNHISADGRTPLLAAAGYSHSRRVFEILIAAGADVNSGSPSGHSPLMEAAQKQGDPQIIRMLIDAGSDVNGFDTGGYTALMRAAEYQDNPEIVTMLLDAGADIHASNYSNIAHMIEGTANGMTPLMYAARYQDTPEIVKILLDAGSDVNVRNEDKMSPLMLAARFQTNLKIIKILIESGANLNDCNNDGESALLIAAWYREDIEFFQLLIEAGADLEIRNASGNSALITAAKIADMYDQDLGVVLFLVKSGADLNATNHKGKKTWDLIKNRSKWRNTEEYISLEQAFRQWNLKLNIITALNDNFSKNEIEALLINGGWMETGSYDGWTPLLMKAIEEVPAAGLKFLLELGGDIMTEVADWDKLLDLVLNNNKAVDPEISAAIQKISRLKTLSIDFVLALKENSSYKTIVRFIDEGVSVNLPDENGVTPLEHAASFASPGIIKLLINEGAKNKDCLLKNAAVNNKNLGVFPILFSQLDVDTRDKYGRTPLMHAIQNQIDPQIVTLFVEAGHGFDPGADVNAQDIDGFTPLIIASRWQKDPEFARLLINAGADVNIPSNEGHTPLMEAVISNEGSELIEILINAGADVTLVDNQGLSAWDFIQENGFLADTEVYHRLEELSR